MRLAAKAPCPCRPVSSTLGVVSPTMPKSAAPEFMRFIASDPVALAGSIQHTREKLRAAESLGDSGAVVEHAADLGGMLTTARREFEALELLRKHESLAASLAGGEPLAWFWNALATALQYVGEREAAEAYFAKAVEVARKGGWRRIEAMALHHWGRSLVEQGRLAEAESRIAQALSIREDLNERQESARSALAELARLRAANAA
jgi:tetratricopeptide (TPR) repeat protein